MRVGRAGNAGFLRRPVRETAPRRGVSSPRLDHLRVRDARRHDVLLRACWRFRLHLLRGWLFGA